MKNQSKRKSGFTLVELLVAMAIIGVLLILGIAGFNLARRAGRNTARKSALSEIKAYMEDFETKYKVRASDVDVDPGNNEVTLTSDEGDEETYDLSPMSGITDNVSAATTCNGCDELEKEEFQLILSDDNLGVCLEPDGAEMMEGECSGALGANP